MTDSRKATSELLRQTLAEYGGRISIDGGSIILASDTNVATSIAETTENIRTPYGPSITIAQRSPDTAEDASKVPGGNADVKPVNDLKMDYFTHAVFGVNAEDPKFILTGLKHMLYALRPKGVAIVISLKQDTGKAEGSDDTFNVGLEDKIKYQSRGKADKLVDVLYYAGFERGKIRSFDKAAEIDGQKVEAEVVLAMKWDQLTA